MTPVRRGLVAVTAVPILLGLLLGAAACGSGEIEESDVRTVTIVGQKFTEADIMTQLYRLLLDKDGFTTRVEEVGARDLYLGTLEKGEVQLSADYLSSMTEALNRKANGVDASPLATADVDATLARLTELAEPRGLTPLEPARAEDATAYAVTRAFAEKHHVTTLSDLGRLGRPVTLAAGSDCAERPDCGQGLTSVYRIELARIEPLGLGSEDTVSALTSGQVQLAQVATTDGTLGGRGLVVLRDDKSWQPAQNLVPMVNSAWLKRNPRARDVLNPLSRVLTTADLTALITQVDVDLRPAEAVAENYLKEKGLL